MTNAAAIHAEGLTKHYGDVQALVDLNLEVRAGEIFGFLGPNGAGKTTTIRTLMDEIRATSGTATIVGLDSHTNSVELRNHIGYIPGDLAIYPNLTGRDTLTYFSNLRGDVDWSHVNTLADRLEADLSRKIGDLSTGNRQKVGIIQAFMNRPEVLIMDEPSSGLDPLVQRTFQEMMKEATASGATVFLSSHTLSEVQRVADRVGIIRSGRLIAVEGVQEMRSKAIRRIDLFFDDTAEPAVFESVRGARDIEVRNHHVSLSFDGSMEELLRVASANYTLMDINSQEADLEEIFLTYYREDA